MYYLTEISTLFLKGLREFLGLLVFLFVLSWFLFCSQFSKNLEAGECPTNSTWKQIVSFLTISNTCSDGSLLIFFSYRNPQNWRTSKTMRCDWSHLVSEHKYCNVKPNPSLLAEKNSPERSPGHCKGEDNIKSF